MVSVRARLVAVLVLVVLVGGLVSACAGPRIGPGPQNDGLMRVGPFTFILPQPPSAAAPEVKTVTEPAPAIEAPVVVAPAVEAPSVKAPVSETSTMVESQTESYFGLTCTPGH